jgi:ABC-2 type transport system permease protein
MFTVAAGYASEVDRYPGGPAAMAAGMQPSVQALRLLRWPGERLDTLGGYLTYHNVTMFGFALSIYAAVQGAHAIRGAERRGMIAQILAAGRPRPALLVDRATGFALTLALIGAGLGLSIAAAMAYGGQPDIGGSLITALMCSLAALTAYALGMLLGQLVARPRAAASAAAFTVTGLYLLTNVADQIGFAGGLRYLSPFFYVNLARALVPGQGFSLVAVLALFGLSAVLNAIAAWAFGRRDYGAGMWTRRPTAVNRRVRVQRPALRRVWTAELLRHRGGLTVWAVAAAATMALMGWEGPAVIDLWDKFELTQTMIGSDPSHSIADQYLGFAAQLVLPIIAAYAVTEAAGWVDDLQHGRIELLLAAPISWPGLLRQRLAAALAGVTVITVAALGALAGVAAAVGMKVDLAGLARLGADTLLLAAALCTVALLLVAWLRGGAAITGLAIYLTASYLLIYLVRLFSWPDWINRLSLLGAYGNPYLQWPAWNSVAAVVAIAATAFVLAAAVAVRSPKTA